MAGGDTTNSANQDQGKGHGAGRFMDGGLQPWDYQVPTVGTADPWMPTPAPSRADAPPELQPYTALPDPSVDQGPGGGPGPGGGGGGVDPGDFDPRAEEYPGGLSNLFGGGTLGRVGSLIVGSAFPPAGIANMLTGGMAAHLGPYGVVGGPSAPRPGSVEFRNVVNAGRVADRYNDGGEGYERGVDANEDFQGQAMRDYERDYGGGDRGDDRDSGGTSGDARGGRDGGTSFHQGGAITDSNPNTYKDNMRITAQEGEHVMSRDAVGLLGRGLLNRANQAAAK